MWQHLSTSKSMAVDPSPLGVTCHCGIVVVVKSLIQYPLQTRQDSLTRLRRDVDLF
jgi:hypothetical protein